MESYQNILDINVDDIVKKGQLATEKRKQKKIQMLKRLLCLLIIICFGSCAFCVWFTKTRDRRVVQAVEEAINDLQLDPKGNTASILHTIQLYDSLTEAQTALIPDAPVLIMEEAINSIKSAPKGSTVAISLAMQFYDGLTEEQQALIPDAPVLIVEEAIKSIGTVSRGSKEVIKLSFELYNNLTKTQKSLVSNYEILKEARSIYVYSYKM